MPKIPDCYEADRQYEAMDLAYTARLMRRPKCVCCGAHLLGDSYLDLNEFGIPGYACQRCLERCTCSTEDLDDDYD